MNLLLKGLNKNQKKAVLTTEGPLLVVAGAGTGKTKVITHRIAHLISQDIAPEKILAVTFTNKASQEMRERVAQLTGLRLNGQGGPNIGTFHSIASDILRNHGDCIGIPLQFSIINEQKGLELIKSIIEKFGLDLRQFRPASIQNLISQKKSSFDKNNEDFFPKNFNLIFNKYSESLSELKALDFDDLIQKTVLLFENRLEILQIYQEKWPYIHIDEYQDTDPIQEQLMRLLAKSARNICAVGDEDQSIYGFRGADFTNILNFEQVWPGTQIATLDKNYRSTGKILDAANAVISKNKLRREKNLYSRGKKGGNLTIFEAENEKEEADFVAGKIENLLRKETLTSPIAVLCRANFQFQAFEEAFAGHSIPYQAAPNQDSLSNGNPRPVRLMTIHAAKGLEFKYVFIPGLEKGLFPHANANSEEERRLFYVALTRAEEKIFLSFSRYRTAFGAKQINQPSQFLEDIPKNLIKWA